MPDDTSWCPLLPGDGPADFPTDDRYTLSIRTRHDGYYECTVLNEETGKPMARWHLSPDNGIAICVRKTQAQAAKDEAAYLAQLAAIMGVEEATA